MVNDHDNESKIDPSDLLWSIDHINMAENAPGWPASRATLERVVVREHGTKFEYSAAAPTSKRDFIREMLGELGYNSVPFRTYEPQDVKKWQNIDVYRSGPEERFIQLTVKYGDEDQTY